MNKTLSFLIVIFLGISFQLQASDGIGSATNRGIKRAVAPAQDYCSACTLELTGESVEQVCGHLFCVACNAIPTQICTECLVGLPDAVEPIAPAAAPPVVYAPNPVPEVAYVFDAAPPAVPDVFDEQWLYEQIRQHYADGRELLYPHLQEETPYFLKKAGKMLLKRLEHRTYVKWFVDVKGGIISPQFIRDVLADKNMLAFRGICGGISNHAVLRALFTHNYDFGKTCLHKVAQLFETRDVQAVLNSFPDAAQKSAFVKTEDNDGETALHDAVRDGSCGKFLALMRHITPEEQSAWVMHPNSNNETLLHYAADNGRVSLIKHILTFVAQEQKEDFARMIDREGKTALHWAVQDSKGVDVVNELCDICTTPATQVAYLETADDEGCTALHYAAGTGCVQLIQSLVNRFPEGATRADFVKFTDNNADTALHYAVRSGSLEAVRVLLSCISDPAERVAFINQDDDDDLSVLDLAQDFPCIEAYLNTLLI